MKRLPTGLICNLLLATSLTSSSPGCKPPLTLPPPVDTSWVKPIVFHQETKDWLASLQWPATAYEDFDQIRKFNEKYYEITGMKPPATQPTTYP